MFVRKYSHELLYTILTRLVNVFTWIVVLTSVLRLIKIQQPPLPTSPLLPDADVSAAPTPKSQWRSSPLTPGSDLRSFDPSLAVEIGATKAVILQKIWDWMEYNRIEGKMDHLIEGQWYSYNSAREWRDRHFWYLSVPTVKAVFQQLEEEGYIERIQHRKQRGDCRMWVTIPAAARARIDTISTANTPSDKKTPREDKKTPPLGEKDSPTKENPQIENPQILNSNPKQQQLLQSPETETILALETEDVVVVDLSSSEPESDQHTMEGKKRDVIAVKAFVPHDQHHDEEPISKVPLKVLSPALAAKMASTLGFEEGFAQTLIQKYGAGRVRSLAMYAEEHEDIRNPPGWMRVELERNELRRAAVHDDDWDTAYEPEEADDSEAFAALARAQEDEWEMQVIEQLGSREHIAPLPEPVGLDIKPSGSMTAGDVWHTAHMQLGSLFDRASFERWLKQAEFHGYELSTGTFTIGVPTAEAQDMLQHRYYRNVQRVVEGLANSPVTLQFELCPPLAPHQLPLSDYERTTLNRLREARALVV